MAEKKERSIIRSRSPHHRVVYSNSIQLTTTNVDARLRFACVESSSPEQLVVEDQVDVMLGPVELLGLHQLIGRNLKRFNVEQVPAGMTSDEEQKQTTPDE